MKTGQPKAEHRFCVFQSDVMETNKPPISETVLWAQGWNDDFSVPRVCPEAQPQQRWDSSTACSPCPDQTFQHPLFSPFSPSCSSHIALFLRNCFYSSVLIWKYLSCILCSIFPHPDYCKSLHTSLKTSEEEKNWNQLWVLWSLLLLCYAAIRLFWTPPLISYLCKDFSKA